MFDEHTITLQSVSPAPRPYLQAVCACGWKPGPTVSRPYQERIAEVHLAGVRDKALKAALLAAGERGEKIDVSAWKEAHPLPKLLPA